MKPEKREYSRNVRYSRTLALAALLMVAVGVVFIPRSMSAKSKRPDINAMAEDARLSAYMSAVSAMANDDSSYYARRLMMRTVGQQSDNPDVDQWALYEEIAITPKVRRDEAAVDRLIDALERQPHAPDPYYVMAITEGNTRQQYEAVKLWYDNNPDNMIAARMWLFVRAFALNPELDAETARIFKSYIENRADTAVAKELVADSRAYTTRFGVHPMNEDVGLRMMMVLGDTAAILERAAKLSESYATDPDIGPILVNAYVNAGRPDEASAMRIKLFEANPSGEMIGAVYGSLATQADTTNLFQAVVRAIRRPDLELDDKTGLIHASAYILLQQADYFGDREDYFMGLADSVVDASREVMAEFDDDWEAVREITNFRQPDWVRAKSYPLLVDYALAHPDSIETNFEIASRLIDLVDSIPQLEEVILNLCRRMPERVDVRMLYPVWLAKMERHGEAVKEFGALSYDDIRRAVVSMLGQIRKNRGEDFEDEPDSASLEEAVRHTWFQTKTLHAQSLAKLNRFGDAAKVTLAVIDFIDDENNRAVALNNAAYFLGETGENLDRALELADSSLAVARETMTMDTRAWILHKLGRNDEALDQMKEIYCKPIILGDDTFDMCKLTDYKAFEKEIASLIEMTESDADDIVSLLPGVRQFIILLAFNGLNVNNVESTEEYLLHLYKILRGAGDDYGAYSVGLWLATFSSYSSDINKEIRALADKLGEKDPLDSEPEP